MSITKGEAVLGVSRESIVRALRWGRNNYEETFTKESSQAVRSWWDGYIRAMEHVLEMENE